MALAATSHSAVTAEAIRMVFLPQCWRVVLCRCARFLLVPKFAGICGTLSGELRNQRERPRPAPTRHAAQHPAGDTLLTPIEDSFRWHPNLSRPANPLRPPFR